MLFVKAFERFDWLAPSDVAEKLRSIRLSNTRVAERLDVTIVRNKQCKYNSRYAARGKIRVVENRLKNLLAHFEECEKGLFSLFLSIHAMPF